MVLSMSRSLSPMIKRTPVIEVITSEENLNRAYKKVISNKGASGVDGIIVEELGEYIKKTKRGL